MTDSASDRHPLELLTAEFVERYRRGEQPTVAEYAAKYPLLADRIRNLLPTAVLMEDLKRRTLPAGVVDVTLSLERLGDCRIVREVGRGGMGVVYEAEQESLGRRVAVKVLPAGAADGPDHLRRFEREARAAARLHHTNIVPVFGVGEQDGLHYYVMQFIDGRGLDQVLSDLASGGRQPPDGSTHQGADAPRPPTSAIPPYAGRGYWPFVARLGAQAAEALDYAHGQGVLHRDVKPANLLLDRRGTVWVADFGLARLADPDPLGEAGGTLRYMAPERLQGLADARGDVYSLGLTLYELLTLRQAFGASDRGQLLRQVTQGEPPRPRALNPAVPRDLEAVVLKATARDPARRYPTAGALAADLQRFRDDKPVEARRPLVTERLGRWCRRNPAVAVLTAAVLSLLVLVAVVATAGYVQTRRALDREAQHLAETEAALDREARQREQTEQALGREARQRGRAEAERGRAEANLSLALEVMGGIYEQVAAGGLAHPVEPQLADGTEEARFQPLLSESVAAVLNNALRFYDRFAEQNSTNPRLRRETARANRRVGDIEQRLGRVERAERAYRQAVAICEKLAAEFPAEPEYQAELAGAHAELGGVLELMGRFPEAEQAYRQGLKRIEKVVGEYPDEPGYRHELARACNLLGGLLWRVGRLKDGEDYHRQALGLLKQLIAQGPARPEYRQALARSHLNLASVLRLQNKQRDASQAVGEAAAVFGKLAEDYPTVPDYRAEWSEACGMQGFDLQIARRMQSAERLLRRSLDIAGRLAADYPAVPQYQGLRARAHRRLGSLLELTKRPDDAEKEFRQAVRIHEDLAMQFPAVPSYQLFLSEARFALANLVRDRDDAEAARPLLEQALLDLEMFLAANADSLYGRHLLVRQYQALGQIHLRLGETARARAALRKADEARKRLEPDPRAPRRRP